jgi:UDPglucose 6-dehydrogenase
LLAQHNEAVALNFIAEKVNMLNRRKSPIKDLEIEDYLTSKILNLRTTLSKQEADLNLAKRISYDLADVKPKIYT